MKNETEILIELNELRKRLKLDVERWDGTRNEKIKKIIQSQMMESYEEILLTDTIKRLIALGMEPSVRTVKDIYDKKSRDEWIKQLDMSGIW